MMPKEVSRRHLSHNSHYNTSSIVKKIRSVPALAAKPVDGDPTWISHGIIAFVCQSPCFSTGLSR
jgi:hypothetical protein